MPKYTYLTFVFILLCLQPGVAQRNRARAVRAALPAPQMSDAGLSRHDKRTLQQGDDYFLAEQYAEAQKFYAALVAARPDEMGVAYRLAECHRHLFNYAAAEAVYGKVAYGDSTAYPLAVFHYALMQKRNGKYAYALNTFDIFTRQAGRLNASQLPEKEKWIARAKLEQEGCQSALMRDKFLQRDFAFRPLAQPANSPAHDYAPAILGSDSLIAITSSRTNGKTAVDGRYGQGFGDFYVYERYKDTVWLPKTTAEIAVMTNTAWNEGSGFLADGGNRFYFTNCKGADVDCAIFVSERKNGRWQKPVRLNNQVNRPGSDSRHPALTPGGDTLYFASNRPGGLGLNDIWMSAKTNGGDWQEPSNLGPRVNTAENDISPFYYAREKQLFFASDGRMGMGGLDVYFMSLATGSTNQAVVNLGRPFNSSRDDAFLVLGREKGFLASNRFSNQGDFDIHTFSINSRQSDLIALNKTDELRRPDLAYLAEFQFEYLTDEDKLLLDRIMGKREADRLHGTDLPLEERERYFYEHLSSEEKARLARMTRALAARRDSATLLAQDRHHFEMAASEEYRNQVKRVAEAYRKAIADGSAPVLTDEKFLYDSLAHEERNRFHRQVAGALSKRLGTDESRLAAEIYAYEQLPPEEKNRLSRMAAERFAAKLNQHDEQFREADKFYYENLSLEEKARLDRLMAARKPLFGDNGDNIDASALSEKDKTFYEQLPPEARERLNRMAAARYASTLNATDERFGKADKFYYENLSPEERSRLDRLVTARVTGNRLALDGVGLSEGDRFYYTQLSPEEKDRLERMAAARRAAKLNGTDAAFAEADKFYYENLSPEEKARLDRLVAARNAASRQQADNSELVTENRFSFERLPSEADQQKRRQTQRKTKMLPLADASAPDTGRDNVLSHLDASKMGGYKEVKLTGRLVDAQSGKPVSGLSLQLTEGQNDVITTTTTNPDGTFQYLNLPISKQLRIRIETAVSSLTDQQTLYVQNLALTAYRDATRPVSFNPAYFAFDSHVLSKRAIRTLDSLVTFYKKQPDSQIELNAFADASGTEEYNLRLSRQRGAAVQKYLLSKGVPPGGIVMYARGEVKSAKPAERNPAFRKVTVSIQSSNAHLNTAETFVVLPDTDLKAIAEKTGVAIEELRRLNGFKTDTVEAYRPIRVK